jgi:uncharacterized protein (DUF427 family)
MVRAMWNGEVLAQSDDTRVVEGNHYFPAASVREDVLVPSPTTSRCFWKGKARYFSVVAGDDVNVDAAWTYPDPWPLARSLRDHVAFWRGVRIES